MPQQNRKESQTNVIETNVKTKTMKRKISRDNISTSGIAGDNKENSIDDDKNGVVLDDTKTMKRKISQDNISTSGIAGDNKENSIDDDKNGDLLDDTKTMKRKISQDNISTSGIAGDNKENSIDDDKNGDLLDDNISKALPSSPDDGSDRDESESSLSGFDSDEIAKECEELSFEEMSDIDSDFYYQQYKNPTVLTTKPTVITRGMRKKFKSPKFLDKEVFNSMSGEKSESNAHNRLHRKNIEQVNEESMGGKQLTFREMVLEQMRQSQKKAEWEETSRNKVKTKKLPKEKLPIVVDKYLTKSNIEKGEEMEAEQERYLKKLYEDTEYRGSPEKEEQESKEDSMEGGDESEDEDHSSSEDDSLDDDTDGEITEGLKRDLLGKTSILRKAKADAVKDDEYEYDTSDEEDVRNTIGNIPLNWYDNYKHVGYTREGKKILKPPPKDEIDKFLKKMEDPNFWRTVKDPQTGHDVVLTESDANFANRLQENKIPDSDYQEYTPWIDWFSSEVLQMPLRKFPEHKRSFICSRNEARMVSVLASRIKRGWIKPQEKKSREPVFFNLWESDTNTEHMRRIHDHIPAPKRHLPNHAESYNPPPEYLFDSKELKEWRKLKDYPSKRKLHFIPRKYNSLREVPLYDRYIQERFLRCLDLYLCPRQRKMKLLIEPEDLVPTLPSPKDLQPFPTTQSLVYKGHADMVRSISVEPKGQYLASGSDDMTVKIWEVATGRCVRTIPAGGIVRSVKWCPNPALSLLAVAADRKLLLINPDVGDKLIVKKTDSLLEEHPENDVLVPVRVRNAVQWEQAVGDEWKKGVRIIINHFKEIKQVTWHGRGDYFSTVMSDAQNRSVIIHQISKRRSQIPFNKPKGLIQCVLFHPIRPIFFVASQKNVRVYDLVKQEMMKKLMSNSKWISSMAVHPGGDNLLVSTYDRKLLWFDLDLSTTPYQTLRVHSCAVRGVAYHKRYPLFASCSDDNSVIVSHGMVYQNDLLKNALIVPLKRLTYHEQINDFSSFDVVFHPSQPWLFSSGADGTVRLYT